MNQQPRLENWVRYGTFFMGNVYNHLSFADGSLVRTSRCHAFSIEERWLETRNTRYALGTPAKSA